MDREGINNLALRGNLSTPPLYNEFNEDLIV
jgi:hypothetical protein